LSELVIELLSQHIADISVIIHKSQNYYAVVKYTMLYEVTISDSSP